VGAERVCVPLLLRSCAGIGLFQDVTLRLIATRLLPGDYGSTYVSGEKANLRRKPIFPPTQQYHIYCSIYNHGAEGLLTEIAAKRGFKIEKEPCDHGYSRIRRQSWFFDRPPSFGSGKLSKSIGVAIDSAMKRSPLAENSVSVARKRLKLHVTSNAEELQNSDHMLLYLTSKTWTSGDDSKALAKEVSGITAMKLRFAYRRSDKVIALLCVCASPQVEMAMDAEVHLMLAHEMPGGGATQQRSGVEFKTFFEATTTPINL
jgi:hypothetical protein